MDERKLSPVDSIADLEALARLLTIAQRDTGQSSRVATFLPMLRRTAGGIRSTSGNWTTRFASTCCWFCG
jgi:hypothetical protein